jgi:Peptidase family C25
MVNRMKHRQILTLIIVWVLFNAGAALAQATAFTYQGKLVDNGNPASGNYDLTFKLFDTATVGNGSQQGANLSLTNVAVTSGIFTVQLDFGACGSCFNGANRFLEISVKATSGSTFTTLSPRQPITSTPYTIKSLSAATADGLSVTCVSCVTSSQIQGVLYSSTSWKKKPRFVLIGGQGSFDPKGYLGQADADKAATKLIDTQLMETASDDWFVDFDGDGLAELAIGRLPFRSEAEAAVMVAKIVAYEQASPSEELMLVADSNDGFNFESASAALDGLMPANLKVNHINRGTMDGETARRQLLEALNRGQKIVNYIGHGNVDQWRANLLTNEDARGLANGQHLSLFVMMTCLNGYFEDPVLRSLAEELMRSERGGAVAVWASDGMTFPADQALINQQLYRLLFGAGDPKVQPMTLGEATQRAKAATTEADVRRTWILFGDPTLRLNH